MVYLYFTTSSWWKIHCMPIPRMGSELSFVLSTKWKYGWMNLLQEMIETILKLLSNEANQDLSVICPNLNNPFNIAINIHLQKAQPVNLNTSLYFSSRAFSWTQPFISIMDDKRSRKSVNSVFKVAGLLIASRNSFSGELHSNYLKQRYN